MIHLTLLFALVDAAGSHSGSHNHRSLSHRKLRRASVEPFNPEPNCPKRNHFKKLRDAQGLSSGAEALNNNGTTLASDSTSTSTSVISSAVSSSSSSTSIMNSGSTKAPSSTSSSTKPSEPTSKPPFTSPSGGLSSLFPLGQPSKSWSTSPQSPNPLSISPSTLQPFQVARSNPYSISKAPDGRDALKAHFNKGSYRLLDSPTGGFSFYASGPESVDLTRAREATFGYTVFFPEGFDFNKGGKLPGFFGGDSQDESTSCSGGRRSTACFSARLMWREDGAGELYTYFPPGFSANNKLCSVPPFSECNPEYGASVGRGSFRFQRGMWTTVAERARLNDVGESNGEVQVWVGGRSVVDVRGVVVRARGEGKIRGAQFQTFFGGSTSDWASPKDQDAYFPDFSVAITESF